MEKPKIRSLNKSDLDQIYELMKTREDLDEEGALKRTQLFEWMAFHNPFANGRTTYFVAEISGNIVAHLGRMPVNFLIGGKSRTIYFQHDLYVHPNARKKGLAKILYNSLDECSDSLVLTGLWANPINLSILRKRGYYETGAPKYVKILNTKKLLDPRFKLKIPQIKHLVNLLGPVLNLIIKIVDFFFLKMPVRNVRIKEITKFDQQVDEFYHGLFPKLGFTIYRSCRYLNWKYVDRPFNRNKIFVAEKGGKMSGFVVLGPFSKDYLWKVSILDILADPDDKQTIAAICKAVIAYYRQTNVYAINVILTEKKIEKIFKRHLFLKDRSREPFLMTNMEKCPGLHTDFMEISNWQLSYGDSDGFMWNF